MDWGAEAVESHSRPGWTAIAVTAGGVRITMNRFLDKLATVGGLPVLIGVALVILNLVVRCVAYYLIPDAHSAGFLLFLFTDGNLLLHLGVIVGLLGVLLGDVL